MRHLETTIQSLEGALNFNPLSSDINKRLAHYLILQGNLDRAGKYLYLEDKALQVEYQSVYLFEKSLGFDPIHIARHILPKNYFAVSRANHNKKLILGGLINRIKDKYRLTPRFLQGIERHLRKSGIDVRP